jgi:hypothetical protein
MLTCNCSLFPLFINIACLSHYISVCWLHWAQSVCLPWLPHGRHAFLPGGQSSPLPHVFVCLSVFLSVTAGHFDAHGPRGEQVLQGLSSQGLCDVLSIVRSILPPAASCCHAQSQPYSADQLQQTSPKLLAFHCFVCCDMCMSLKSFISADLICIILFHRAAAAPRARQQGQ